MTVGATVRRMDIREALYTTRAMRRVKPDPIPDKIQERIMDAAIRAPSGGNSQNWKFLLVDDPAVKGKVGPLYRASLTDLWGSIYKERIDEAAADPDSADSKQMMRIKKSADWLADHFAEVPLFLFGFAQYDPTGGSIFPAIWSAQSRLAPRASAARSRRCCCSATTRSSTSSASRRTTAGTWPVVCRSATPPGSGASRPRPRARGDLPQPVGRRAGLRDPRAALALRRRPLTRRSLNHWGARAPCRSCRTARCARATCSSAR